MEANLIIHLTGVNPLKYIPNTEASKELNFVRKPEIKPDNTSPQPPTVIAGVVLLTKDTWRSLLKNDEMKFVNPLRTIVIPYFSDNLLIFAICSF